MQNTTVIFTSQIQTESMLIYNSLQNLFLQEKIIYLNLGQRNIILVVSILDFMIGNSSSGILEMPTFKKFSINIGERQSDV